MRYVTVDKIGAGKVHLVPLHTGHTLCAVRAGRPNEGVFSGTNPKNLSELKYHVREVPGPATCEWCLESLSDLLRSINEQRQAS